MRAPAKLLVVLPSHAAISDTGRQTGVWSEELAEAGNRMLGDLADRRPEPEASVVEDFPDLPTCWTPCDTSRGTA